MDGICCRLMMVPIYILMSTVRCCSVPTWAVVPPLWGAVTPACHISYHMASSLVTSCWQQNDQPALFSVHDGGITTCLVGRVWWPRLNPEISVLWIKWPYLKPFMISQFHAFILFHLFPSRGAIALLISMHIGSTDCSLNRLIDHLLHLYLTFFYFLIDSCFMFHSFFSL